MPKLKANQLLNKDPFRSILWLLKRNGIKRNSQNEVVNIGLKAKHFMYALEPNPEKNDELEEFFKEELEESIIEKLTPSPGPCSDILPFLDLNEENIFE